AAIKRSRPDVVFLDIQMPGLDGFGVLETIADDAPYVVFVTANDRHAIRAFEFGAVDYLLKPYTPQRFEQVLDRARERISATTRSEAELPAPTRTPLQRLLVIDDGRAVFLPVDRIDRIESERNYVTLVSGPYRYRLRATLAAVADRLDRAHFLRINRSTLVRLDAVKTMHEWSHGDFRVVMHDGTELVWSRRYRAAAEREFGIDG
ncbi:MAG TPA: LytTR family DNA-binding domain-containing protein, partial [Gemmatimonadaceae bacterium]|nr:LytTR family DNA-binding domain-containing protein [Gemmatimonadaceae bacterium]